MILDELADDVGFAQQLGEVEHQVGSGDPFAQRSAQVHAHHIGRQEIDGLTEHARLGLDATNAPTHYAEPIDHSGMRVGADERIRVVDALFFQYALRQIF